MTPSHFTPDTTDTYVAETHVQGQLILTVRLLADLDDSSVESCFPEEEQRETVYELIDTYGNWGHAALTVEATLTRSGTPPTVLGQGEAYLGSCAYAGPADFLHPGNYYPQVRAEALDDLAADLSSEDAQTLSQWAVPAWSYADYIAHMNRYFEVEAPQLTLALSETEGETTLHLTADGANHQRVFSAATALSRRTSRAARQQVIQRAAWLALEAAQNGQDVEHAARSALDSGGVAPSVQHEGLTLGPADLLYLVHCSREDTFEGLAGTWNGAHRGNVFIAPHTAYLLLNELAQKSLQPAPPPVAVHTGRRRLKDTP